VRIIERCRAGSQGRTGASACQKLLRPALNAFEAGKQIPNLTKPVEAGCTSPATMCYWFTVSLIAWGVLNLIGIYYRPLHASSGAAFLLAMAAGCLANWLRNRSFHCAITGPLFLLAGVVLLLSDVRTVQVSTFWVWPFVLIGAGIAFLLEWRYANRRGYQVKETGVII
jgi:hypothetical protein